VAGAELQEHTASTANRIKSFQCLAEAASLQDFASQLNDTTSCRSLKKKPKIPSKTPKILRLNKPVHLKKTDTAQF
jgi:hypothetical protein